MLSVLYESNKRACWKISLRTDDNPTNSRRWNSIYVVSVLRPAPDYNRLDKIELVWFYPDFNMFSNKICLFF